MADALHNNRDNATKNFSVDDNWNSRITNNGKNNGSAESRVKENLTQEKEEKKENDLGEIIEHFLTEYRDKNGIPIYQRQLEDVIREKRHMLIIDYKDLKRFNEKLAEEVAEEPEKMIEEISNYIHVEKLVPTDERFWNKEGKDFTIGIIGYEDRVLSPSDINRNVLRKLITVEGIVASISDKKEFTLVRAVRYRYVAVRDGSTAILQVSKVKHFKQDYLSDDPIYDKFCEECGKLSAKVEFVDEEAVKTDRSIAILQDKPERMKEGQVEPSSLILILTRDLAGTLNPGDIVKVTGYLRTRQNSEGGKNSEDYYFVVLGVEYEQMPYYENTLTEEDLRKIEEFKRKPKQFMRDFIDSIAPTVHGLEDVKEAAALSLVGGDTVYLPDGKDSGYIHILIIGEPGIGKTKLLRAIQRIAPKSIYVSGENATKVGLSVGVDTDPVTGLRMVQAGALALADGGFVLLDEIDKLNPADIPSLREAMQDQIITMNKIKKARLNSRTTIIAAGNPKGDSFGNGDRLQYIDLNKSILTRFDLIFTIPHVPDEGTVEHYYESTAKTTNHGLMEFMHNAPIPDDLMKKLIVYARTVLKTQFTPEAYNLMIRYGKGLVQLGQEYKKARAILSNRILGSLRRLSIAYAKLQLKDKVEVEDVVMAYQMIRKSLDSLGILRKEEE